MILILNSAPVNIKEGRRLQIRCAVLSYLLLTYRNVGIMGVARKFRLGEGGAFFHLSPQSTIGQR